MRVLDLGSGSGDVAVLAAEAMGPDGYVVGTDRDPRAVERARRWTADRPNVEFRECDVTSLDGIVGKFDAVVGRALLMYLPDPAASLRAAATRVRPGGVVCMHEPDVTYRWTSHATPLWEQLRELILGTLDGAGAPVGWACRCSPRSAPPGSPVPS